MRRILFSALALGAIVCTSAPADARQGCGRGFHRDFYGRCVPNRARIIVGAPPVVGVWYPHRGYWYGGHYWWHRDRWHGGWRYR